MKPVLGSNSDAPRVVECQLQVALNSEHVTLAWPHFVPALKETWHLLADVWTEDNLLVAAMTGRVQLWAYKEGDELKGRFLTQFYQTETTPIFQIFWAYCDGLEEMLPILSDAFDNFAASNGATKIEIQGRRGFERMLKRQNFDVDYVVYSRRVAPKKGN